MLEQTRHQLALSEERLRRLSPYEKLESGYGCILTEDGRRIRSVSQVAPGEVVQICLADGRMTARIQEVKETKIDGGKRKSPDPLGGIWGFRIRKGRMRDGRAK